MLALNQLGYAVRQVMFARACNGRLQQSAVESALSRALGALESVAEAIQHPTPLQLTDSEWDELMSDATLESIFGDADGYTDAERALLARESECAS